MPVLVLMTGLPGTGKSTIAAAVARALPGALIAADPIDAALVRAGMRAEQRPDIAGYEVMRAVVREQLAAGLSAVVDAVNPFDFVRAAYFAIAAEHGAAVAVIVTTCSDAAEHRRRVEERHAAGLSPADWNEVLRQVGYYEAFAGELLRLNAMEDATANARAAVAYVASIVATAR
jgi:predicted kinase